MSEEKSSSRKSKKTEEKLVPLNIEFNKSMADFVKREAKESGMTELEFVEDMLGGQVALLEFEETAGKMGMKWWKPEGVSEAPPDPEKQYTEYRDLRETFEPVSAGINYHKKFMTGGGVTVDVDDPLDKHQSEMREEIETFNRNVEQDWYTRGLERIVDILTDEGLTVGCAAAEIVYSNDEVFDFYHIEGRPDLITEIKEITDSKDKNKKVQISIPRKLESQDWKILGKENEEGKSGIIRLKFIDNAIINLTPVRDPDSLDVIYWTLSRTASVPTTLGIGEKKQAAVEPLLLHPWQVFLIGFNRRGLELKGISLIKSVLNTSRIMKSVMAALEKGYVRWSDRKYFFVCLEEGSLVWTPDGYRPIESIKVGDSVWSDIGEAEILQTFKNPYKGDLIVVKPKMLEEVRFTPNHPVKVARKIRMRTKEGHEKYLTKFEILDGYKRADELTTDDWVIVPKIKESEDIWIEFPDMSHDMGRGNGRNPKPIPSQYLGENLAKLFGWYLAEGFPASSGYRIEFSLNKNETEYADEIASLIKECLGLESDISERETALVVGVNSLIFAQFMTDNFGSGAGNKHLPDTFLYWKPEMLAAMVSRILKGDGYLGEDNWWNLMLNSKMLLKQLQLALLKVGHRASFAPRPREETAEICGRKINQHDAWILRWNEESKCIAEDEDNYFFRIMEIGKKPYEGYVYNLHTSMNKYYLPFEVKNCGTERRPWGKVSTRNFIKAMEQMIKNNWTGIPVPVGFDIKEIGGEVFDARDFLDYLKGLIASGMNYPLEFLEQGGMRENDKAWLAWQVTYGAEQMMLKQDIETQLWEKQLWATKGMTFREKKQGVTARRRRRVPVYLPHLQWRDETKWHMETRIKMDAQILNVANPVGPQLKLGVEKDIAKMMGFHDIIFPTFEELEKGLTKQDKTDEISEENKKLKAQIEQLQLEYQIEHPELIQQAAMAKVQPQQKTKEPTEEGEGDEEEEEKEKRPLPEAGQRLTGPPYGGVSRETEQTGTESKKGIAKPLGGTRQPKRVRRL